MDSKVVAKAFLLLLFIHISESSNSVRSSSYSCQDSGSLTDVSTKTLVSQLPSRSRIYCATICISHGGCFHFQHDKKLGVCLIYSNEDSSQPGAHSDVITCSVQDNTNLVKLCQVFQGGVAFLRRINGTVDFNRTYAEYQKGFGDSDGEFWLGLDCLHYLTNASGPYKLLVNLTDWSGARLWAVYNNFSVAGDADGYRLTVGDYDPSSTAGDSMYYNNGIQFTTWDRDQDGMSNNCNEERKGGWWYWACTWANPTGLYKPAGYTGWDGLMWNYAYNDLRSFKNIEMKLQQA